MKFSKFFAAIFLLSTWAGINNVYAITVCEHAAFDNPAANTKPAYLITKNFIKIDKTGKVMVDEKAFKNLKAKHEESGTLSLIKTEMPNQSISIKGFYTHSSGEAVEYTTHKIILTEEGKIRSYSNKLINGDSDKLNKFIEFSTDNEICYPTRINYQESVYNYTDHYDRSLITDTRICRDFVKHLRSVEQWAWDNPESLKTLNKIISVYEDLNPSGTFSNIYDFDLNWKNAGNGYSGLDPALSTALKHINDCATLGQLTVRKLLAE